MSKRVRLFLAHPKDHPRIEEMRQRLYDMLRPSTPTIEIVTGEEDWKDGFHRFGGWEGWIYSVGHGTEFDQGSIVPRFTAVVVGPSIHLGKATAGIVRAALQAGKQVLYFDGETQLASVSNVLLVDAQDFAGGWVIQ